jgi:hypothetical protein
MNETLIVTLTFTTLSSILFLIVGFGVGWLAQEHAIKSNPYHRDNLHPEMYDQHGNVIPDEILSVRFENADTFNSDQPGNSGEGWSHPSEWPEEEED